MMIKEYADERHLSLGRAASDLIHRGAESLPRFQTKNGWVIFDLPAGTPSITNETVAQSQQEDEEMEFTRALSPGR